MFKSKEKILPFSGIREKLGKKSDSVLRKHEENKKGYIATFLCWQFLASWDYNNDI